MVKYTVEFIKKGTTRKPYFEMNFISSESHKPMFTWLMNKVDLEEMMAAGKSALELN